MKNRATENFNINMEDINQDIPLDLARSAYRGTSFSPEKRGDQAIADYQNVIKWLAKLISEQAQDERQKAAAQEIFDKLRTKYKSLSLAVLHAESRCLSTMIAGPAKFPVRRAEKANASLQNRLDELLEFNKSLKNRVQKEFDRLVPQSEKRDNEIEVLRTEIAGREKAQETMRQINKLLRKGKQEEADALLKSKDAGLMKVLDAFNHGYAQIYTYELSHNNKNIKHKKHRLAAMEAMLEKAETGNKETQYNGLTVVENYEDVRLQLIFDEKPDPEHIALLKSHGFRWSPRNTAWQRKLTNNALSAFKRLASHMKKLGVIAP